MEASPEPTQPVETVAPRLLGWYARHARALPWRVPPGGDMPADPYRVWLSEVMLQQTTVAAVKAYFERFTERWPTVEALAAAKDEDVLSAWAGLGYYARARNLIACARQVAGDGGFPDTEAGLRRLPGIGDYTAAAVAAIAFGRRAVVVDANIERVTARLFAIDTPLPAARRPIRATVDAMTPDLRAGDFAQALMDLGSGICTPRDPACGICPLVDLCAARAQGDPALLPVKAAKKARPRRTGTAFWIERDGAVLLVDRPGKGMLGGMRALPDDGWGARGDGSGTPPFAARWRTLDETVTHGFTHFTLDLAVMVTQERGDASEGQWWPLDEIEKAGLPTLFARAARLALADRMPE